MTDRATESAAGLLRAARAGALGTLLPDGYPCVTLASVAATDGGKPLFLLSRLALHTRNLALSPKASLLLRDERPPASGEDILTTARLTLIGAVLRSDAPADRTAFLDAHPEAADYAAFTDFAVYAMEIDRAHLVAGFGRIVEIGGEELRAALR